MSSFRMLKPSKLSMVSTVWSRYVFNGAGDVGTVDLS